MDFPQILLNKFCAPQNGNEWNLASQKKIWLLRKRRANFSTHLIRKLLGSLWLCRINLRDTLSKSLLDSFNFCDRYLNDMFSNCLLPKFLIFQPCFIFWLKCNVEMQNQLIGHIIITSMTFF